MKRMFTIYGVCLAALLLVSVVGIYVSQSSGVGPALKKLGGGERDFQAARQELLLGTTSPAEALYRFVLDKSNGISARVQALRILKELANQQKLTEGGSRLAPLLNEDSPELRLATLEALETYGRPDGMEAVAEVFRTAGDTAVVQQSFRTLKAATYPLLGWHGDDGSSHSLGSVLLKSIGEDDSAAVESCLTILEKLPVGKGRLYPQVAEYFSRKGNSKRAARYMRSLGIIRRWWVNGGWDNNKSAGFYRSFPPETTVFDPNATFSLGDTARARWFRVQRTDPNGILQIKNLFVQQKYVISYQFTYIHSPEDREVLLFTGSDDGVRAWVNDSLVQSRNVFRGPQPDDDVTRVRLRKGWNTLLLKISQDLGGWGAYCRLAGLDGEAMDDVRISLTNRLGDNPVRQLLDAMVQGDAEWPLMLDNLDAESDATVHELLAVAVNPEAPAKRRIAALEALRDVNDRRPLPGGEIELAEFAASELSAGAVDDAGRALLETLITMGSARCLDLGLKLRKREKPYPQYCGNRLVSLYCRERIYELGTWNMEKDRSKIERTVGEIASLQPTDPWVLDRLTAFYSEAEDTAKANALSRKINMLPQWLLLKNVMVDTATAGRRYAFATKAAFAQKWEKPGKGWVASQYHGRLMGFDGPRELKAWEEDFCVLSSQVGSRRSGTAYLTVSLGAPYWVFLNGRRIGTEPSRRRARYMVDHRYPQQPFNYDAAAYPVTLRAGINSIVVVFRTRPIVKGPWEMRFRCAFLDERGAPLPCEGMEIAWDQ